MRPALLSLVATAVATLMGGAGPAIAADFSATSTFDKDLDGWTLAPSFGGALAWKDAGGNPGGFAFFKDGGPGLSAIKAPSKFLGDWSSLNKTGVLSWDHRIFYTGGGPVYPFYQAMITGPAGQAVFDFRPPPLMQPLASPIPITGLWTHISAPLTPLTTMGAIPVNGSGWRLSPNTNWEKLLSNVTGLYIRIEMVSNRYSCAAFQEDSDLVDPADLALMPAASAIPGDSNDDGSVDVGDLGILGANYGRTNVILPQRGDLNGDGCVDVGDLGILAYNYGWRIWDHLDADGIDNVYLGMPRITPLPVPEPTMLSLLGLGALALRRRR